MVAGNSLSTAQNVVLSTNIQTFNDSAVFGSPDYYKINLTKQSSLNVRASSLSQDINLNVLDASGNQVNDLTSVNGGSLAESINAVLKPGTYYIQVSPRNSTSTNYSLSVNGSVDFNSDVLWRETSSGNIYYWKMNGTSFTGTSFLGNAGSYQMVGTYDLDNDGYSDIVFQDSSNNFATWYTNNNGIKSFVTGTVGTNERIKGAGDFNGDGNGDLVIHNSVSGEVKFWYGDGTIRSTPAGLDKIGFNVLGFDIQAVGDFNGDGKSDLAWRETSGPGIGKVSIWNLDGNNLVSAGYAFNGTAIGSEWQIRGTGDFNKDGKSDLTWFNSNEQKSYYWILNNNTLVSSGQFGVQVPTGWESLGGFNRAVISDGIGNTTSTAFNIGNLNDPYQYGSFQGVVGLANTADVYKFSLNGTKTVTFGIDSPSTDQVRLELLNSSGTVISSIDNSTSKDHLLNNTAVINQSLGAGDYYLRVTSTDTNTKDGSAYKMNVGKTWLTFQNYATGSVSNTFGYSGSLGTGSSDYISFSNSSQGYLDVALSGLTGDADVWIWQDRNGDGNLAGPTDSVAYKPEYGTTGESLRAFLDPGLYWIQVKGITASNYTVTATGFTNSFSNSEKQFFTMNFRDGVNTSSLSTAQKTEFLKAADYWDSAIAKKNNTTVAGALNITINVDGTQFNNNTTYAKATNSAFTSTNSIQIATGTIWVNPNSSTLSLGNSDFGKIMRHEMGHVLGIGTSWKPYTNGLGFNLVNSSTDFYTGKYGREGLGLIDGTRVAKDVKVNTGEDHWDESINALETMTPFFDAGEDSYLSKLTINALRDLGWEVNVEKDDSFTV